MARPPVEWPIPTYVVEYRERAVLSFRMPLRRLGGVVPAPVQPETVHGYGVVALSVSSGRCLKSVGGIPVLASEFRVAEVLTPVRWQAACRPALVGLCTLRFVTTCHGVARLARTALQLDAEVADLSAAAGVPKGMVESPWPERSLFADQEAAEALLLRPEWYFAPDRDGRLVRAVPVHHYARSTMQLPGQLPALDGGAALVAAALHADPAELALDHALFQKRCTHTYHFPPETIVRTRPLGVSLGTLRASRQPALAA